MADSKDLSGGSRDPDDIRLLELKALFAEFLPDGTEEELGRVASIQSDLDWARLRLERLLVRGIVTGDEYAQAVNGEATWAMRECAMVLGRARCEQLFGEGALDASSDVITAKVDTEDLPQSTSDVNAVKVREAGPSDVAGVLSHRADDGLDEPAGQSKKWQDVLQAVRQVAASNVAVLLLGESGTGKEALARVIHRASPRTAHRFVAVSCAAMPDALVESELFGREPAAFAAADARLGRFELADHGTLFLEGVGELPVAVQASVLRALDARGIERIGSTKRIPVDIRVIATSDPTLRDRVEKGLFREDLFYRLSAISISVPPLRERREDIALLADRFVRRAASAMGKPVRPLSRAVKTALEDYDWPGNVRELENVIKRAVILSASGEISERDLPIATAQRRIPTVSKSLEVAEREELLKVLDTVGWRIEGKGGAAERLGLAPDALRNRLRRLGVMRQEPGKA